MEKVIEYLIENNQFLVFFSAIVISLVCLVWFFFIFKGVKMDSIGSATNNIQSLKLKEVLRTKEKELDRMKHRFENQQKKIQELQENGPEDSEALSSLKTEVEDLKGRLSDYEIIEDDIANLSKYKTQNAELMEQLAKLNPEAVKKIAAQGDDAKAKLDSKKAEASDKKAQKPEPNVKNEA